MTAGITVLYDSWCNCSVWQLV